MTTTEHGNAASFVSVSNRADLTARRVRKRSIGRTEEANASGNALDMPTSVWSDMVRKQIEPQETRKANDGQRPLADASERHRQKERSALRLNVSIAKSSGSLRSAGRHEFEAGLMMARAV